MKQSLFAVCCVCVLSSLVLQSVAVGAQASHRIDAKSPTPTPTATPSGPVDPGNPGAPQASIPKPAVDLVPGTYNYKAILTADGKKIPFTLSTTVKDQGGFWNVQDVTNTPTGSAIDTSVLEKRSLIVRNARFSAKPGSSRETFTGKKGIPMHANFTFKNDEALGSLSVDGHEKTVSTTLHGPLFANYAGSLQSIAALPLADHYSTTFRNFDVQEQKETLMYLRVAGQEYVTVPAGTFETFKIELSQYGAGNDIQTLWVTKYTHTPIKLLTSFQSMQDTTVTLELLSNTAPKQ